MNAYLMFLVLVGCCLAGATSVRSHPTTTTTSTTDEPLKTETTSDPTEIRGGTEKKFPDLQDKFKITLHNIIQLLELSVRELKHGTKDGFTLDSWLKCVNNIGQAFQKAIKSSFSPDTIGVSNKPQAGDDFFSIGSAVKNIQNMIGGLQVTKPSEKKPSSE